MIDFYIDERNCEEALFEYFLNEPYNLQKITLKSIQFFNSWWTKDVLPISLNNFGFWRKHTTIHKHSDPRDDSYFTQYKSVYPPESHFSLTEFCSILNEYLDKVNIKHVKVNCDKSNYLTIELTEDKEFKLRSFFKDLTSDETNTTTTYYKFEMYNKWFGFRQDKFTKKGKYHSTKPLKFYKSDLFLRSNLTKSLYNNQDSNIFCILPVKDGAHNKLQRYELNCTKEINRTTNHLRFEITDENERVINFRKNQVLMHFQLEISPIINEVCDT